MLEEEARKCYFVLVGNIPGELRSAELRAFFSHLVEKRGFVCFHYRHRPEHAAVTAPPRPRQSGSQEGGISNSSVSVTVRGEENPGENRNPPPLAAPTHCCVVAVDKRHASELLRRYGGSHWAKSGGELLRRKVKLSRLTVSYGEVDTHSRESENSHTDGGHTGDDPLACLSSQGGIPWNDLSAIPELNPPSVMPYGNVGTPTSVFMELICQCKLPGRVIKRLNLEFPKTRSKRRYGAVGLDYSGEVMRGGSEEEGEEEEEEVVRRGREKEEERMRGGTENGEDGDKADKEDDIITSDDDHDAEEWERYEALHDDVDKQGRTKERLFEEEMEVVWEKGGSGLVFYTDASHWHDLEGDFDEQCSKEDDWDVDTSLYYDREGGDKGARDMRDIRHQQSIRAGAHQASVFAGFERYTKGIGSKVLRQSGWREGHGVGRTADGRPEPVDTDGQHPRNKAGFGYRGEKLLRHGPRVQKRPRRATRDVIISTVYDRPEEEETTVLRSAPSRTIKYRPQGIQFVAGKTLNPTSCGLDQSS